MNDEPKIGDKYEKDGVTVLVHRVRDKWVYCGRWNDKGDDLVRVPLAEWEQKIKGAKKL